MRGIAIVVLALILEAAVLLQLAVPVPPRAGPPAPEEARAGQPPAGHAVAPCLAEAGRKC